MGFKFADYAHLSTGEQSWTISNTGELKSGMVSVTGVNQWYSQKGTCNRHPGLMPGESCTLTIAFTAQEPGNGGGSNLRVLDTNNIKESFYLYVSHSTTYPLRGSDTADFGTVAVGSTTSKTITFSNPSVQPTDIPLSRFTVPEGFTLSHSCGATLEPKASCTATVTFNPLSAKYYGSNIQFEYGASWPSMAGYVRGTAE